MTKSIVHMLHSLTDILRNIILNFMNPIKPVKTVEAYRLSQLGINPANYKFGVTNFESDKYITVKDTTPAGEQ